MSTLTSDSRLGPYEIVRLIGEGGMGQVYRATDTRLGRTVAIKVLPPELTARDLRQRIEREARAISALQHPNICNDVTRDGQSFIFAASSDTQRSLPLTVIHNWRVGFDLPDAK